VFAIRSRSHRPQIRPSADPAVRRSRRPPIPRPAFLRAAGGRSGQRKDQASPNVDGIGTDLLLSEDFDHGRVTALRHAVASAAAGCGLAGDRLDDFVVAVNELLTNAVRHGGGTGNVALCEVTDHGSGLPEGRSAHPVRPAGDEPGGWGLWLAGRLTDSFDMTTGSIGTAVRISTRISE
jgi:serine/threonine-protein kinase RsbW